ncbi:unnamed protein product [Acanthoscelides obtectus]|uniref:Uncharacterized protein n=1 Tax=Acanthoscelides obtectus TaxID=200917 RepID=A0A9P0JJC9_ACAOB|nr:unnamed protein product [Acanthoscelides obtectus]CAH1972623.1 unnamed protein product [Acanthoscelides obtectus]CAK1639991.1 hypothetical protein AOBTE_LOCUS11488 [Acanthoscelides obtectus]CAK1639999.1 hypothetical protein AOBTE_LOCUS11494 [Acanthoscelides obtectus]
MQFYIVCAVAFFAWCIDARPGGLLEHYGGGGGGHFEGLEGGHLGGGYEIVEHEGISNEITHGGEGGEGGDGGHGHHHHQEEYIDYHAPAKYHYDYHVHDLHTHDIKSQWETRNGDKVKGEYTLVEPDGSKRIVSYTADKHTGFHAIVKKVHDF